MDGELWRKDIDMGKYGGDPLASVDVGCTTIEESLNIPSASPPSTIVSPSPADSPASGLPEGAVLVVWAPGDPDNPQNWSIAWKWTITIFCSVLTLNVFVFFLPVHHSVPVPVISITEKKNMILFVLTIAQLPRLAPHQLLKLS
jgi:hypothetical protein